MSDMQSEVRSKVLVSLTAGEKLLENTLFRLAERVILFNCFRRILFGDDRHIGNIKADFSG